MSVISGPEIERLMKGGAGPNGEKLVIWGGPGIDAGPNSIDVHIGSEIVYYRTGPWWLPTRFHKPIDLKNPPELRRLPLRKDRTWILRPGRVYLGSIKEWIETEGLRPTIDGRSSVGRVGLFVHVTAGAGDDGFRGHFTLEFVATQPVTIRPGDRLCQLTFDMIYGERRKYTGRYQNQPNKPVPTRFDLG